MNTRSMSTKDKQAYQQIKEELTKEYDELTESIFLYMESYIKGNMLETQMFMDEIENIIGISDHNVLINYILLGGER